MYHYTKFELLNAFNKIYIDVQSCIISTIIFFNILQLFRQANPKKCQNCNFDKITQKWEVMFNYLPNTTHFIHFQSVRPKKWNIRNKTNKYRWYFRSRPHQTTLLKKEKTKKHHDFSVFLFNYFNILFNIQSLMQLWFWHWLVDKRC